MCIVPKWKENEGAFDGLARRYTIAWKRCVLRCCLNAKTVGESQVVMSRDFQSDGAETQKI